MVLDSERWEFLMEQNIAMPDLTPRRILDAARHEGLMESALLAALGYDPSQGRPGRAMLNNALERRGYGRRPRHRDRTGTA